MLDLLRHDVRYALRRLRRSPGFTAVAVLTLALGIGGNTAMFTLVDGILLEDLPVRSPDELVEIYTSDDSGYPYVTSSYPDYLDLREATTDVFTGVTASQMNFAAVDDRDGGTAPAMVEMVSGNYFDVLGVPPAVGRDFAPEEARPGAGGEAAVAVVSHAFWRERFDGRRDVSGEGFRVNGRSFTVVGVAPEEFTGTMRGLRPDFWIPLAGAAVLDPSEGGDGSRFLGGRGSRSLMLKGRLRDGVGVEEARSAVVTVGRRLAAEYPESNEDREMTVLPTEDVAVHPFVDRALVPVAVLLMSVVGLVLLVACANLASFLLARAEDRRREIAVRRALGAGRGDLVRQLLVETTFLALAGGAGAVILARWIVDLLVGFQPPLPVKVSLDLGVDGGVLAFTAGVSVLAGVAFGLAPAFRAARTELATTLKDASASVVPGRGGFDLRNALVVLQVAASVVLLVGSGLFLRSLRARQDVDPGFETGPAAIATLNLRVSGIPEEAFHETRRRLEERVRAIPGVTAVGLVEHLPLGPSVQTIDLTIPGVDPPPGRDHHTLDYVRVWPGYFEAMGIEVPWGRSFTRAETREDEPVAMVSRAAARRYWPGETPLGKTLGSVGPTGTVRIVGVTGGTKVRTLGEAPRPLVYLPMTPSGTGIFSVVARRPGEGAETLRMLAGAIREVDPDLVVMESKTMAEHLSLVLFAPRMGALLLSAFAALALLLAVVGLYGVVSYVVARRTREVGIRMSLGAEPRQVVALVFRGGVGLAAVGAAAGVVLAGGASFGLSSFLYGVEPLDPVTFVGVPLLLLVVAGGAALVPALRASRVNPMDALRAE